MMVPGSQRDDIADNEPTRSSRRAVGDHQASLNRPSHPRIRRRPRSDVRRTPAALNFAFRSLQYRPGRNCTQEPGTPTLGGVLATRIIGASPLHGDACATTDPTRAPRPRLGGDWSVDVGTFVLAAALGALILSFTMNDTTDR